MRLWFQGTVTLYFTGIQWSKTLTLRNVTKLGLDIDAYQLIYFAFMLMGPKFRPIQILALNYFATRWGFACQNVQTVGTEKPSSAGSVRYLSRNNFCFAENLCNFTWMRLLLRPTPMLSGGSRAGIPLPSFERNACSRFAQICFIFSLPPLDKSLMKGSLILSLVLHISWPLNHSQFYI